jgi:hypothetical protein
MTDEPTTPPCVFCGAPTELAIDVAPGGQEHIISVYCYNCEGRGPRKSSIAQAIAAYKDAITQVYTQANTQP